MRAPVVAPLPAELLALEVVHGGDQERAGLVEQPVRLRLTRAERRRRVEAIEHAVAVEEEQPVLGSPSRREEEQLQLIGRQHPVPVQVERDLPVALGQMPRQLEQPLRAHAERPRLVRTRTCPSLSGFGRTAHHAALRALTRSSGSEAAPPEAPPITPSKPLPERTRPPFRAASSSNSASRPTASWRWSLLSGTSSGARSSNSVLLLSHLGANGGAGLTTREVQSRQRIGHPP